MRFIICIFLFLVIEVNGQEFKFEEVVKVDSTFTKDELYNQARKWIAQNSKLLVLGDRQKGELSASSIYNYRTDEKYKGRSCVEGPIKYNVTLLVKDGRYKYIFSSFDHKGSHGNSCRPVDYGIITTSEEAPAKGKGIQYNLGYADVKRKLNELVDGMIKSLKSSMSTKYEGSGEW
ncbi:DUF4468 domain-containing protein [Chryseobacterium taichungense]|uniref:DUF4468 domain-containing protein n=1 Tax=Chryseobacterium taichungense TaxID=295069 RepID=UPI0028AF73EA|nr:DUF4468 domain-containing protein [Chryseobacterium taichungense]